VRSHLVVLTVIRSAGTRALVRMVLESAGHRVIESNGCSQAQLFLNNTQEPDLLLVESSPGGPSKASEFDQLLKSVPRHKLCLVLGMAEQKLCKEGSELGIRYFLRKPVTRGDLEMLVDELRSFVVPEQSGDIIFPSSETAASNTNAPFDMHASLLLEELGEGRFFLAASPQMLEIHRHVKLLANADVPVLILGESGTGKEVIAHAIHKHSQRSRHRFVNVNCAALPAELLESELFGHRQGAFTGAVRDRSGKFEMADRGTILLDEIGELSAPMQAKLLHVLEDGQFTRLGGQESTNVDVRVLAATNVQMESALAEKTFREDLYYRLNVFTIHVPPLRERLEEIPYLIEETIRRAPAEMKNGRDCSFCPRLMDTALLYEWRGNIRELRNFVTRTLILKDQDAAIRELETKIGVPSETAPQEPPVSAPFHRAGMRSAVRDIKERIEARMIQAALDASLWNRRHAAQHLHISYRSLLHKIAQHHLAPRAPCTLKEVSQYNESRTNGALAHRTPTDFASQITASRDLAKTRTGRQLTI
jgi:two-component system, NtrC family, response regulator AtoC